MTLVGHSVGCYIAMNVLWHFEQEEKDKKRDLRCQMLFPMMMGMRETPNGFGTHVHANYLGLATYLLVSGGEKEQRSFLPSNLCKLQCV